jgi:hypothetical protein
VRELAGRAQNDLATALEYPQQKNFKKYVLEHIVCSLDFIESPTREMCPSAGVPVWSVPHATLLHNNNIGFFNVPIYLQSAEIHSDTFSKWCAGKRGRVEQCSVAPLRNKRVKTLCGCREEGVQTKEKYKLRLTTKAYKLSYNYLKCHHKSS